MAFIPVTCEKSAKTDPTTIAFRIPGLNRSKKLLGHLDEVSVVDFDYSDVVRHPLVSKIVKAYSDQEND